MPPPPKMSIIQFPRTYEYAMLHGKKEFKLQIELRWLISWPYNKEIILDYPGGPNAITRSLQEEDQGQMRIQSFQKEQSLVNTTYWGQWNWPQVSNVQNYKQ